MLIQYDSYPPHVSSKKEMQRTITAYGRNGGAIVSSVNRLDEELMVPMGGLWKNIRILETNYFAY